MAKNGTIGLESTFGSLLTVLPLEKVIEKLTSAKTIFGIENQAIEENSKANLSFFTTNNDWTFSKEECRHKNVESGVHGTFDKIVAQLHYQK